MDKIMDMFSMNFLMTIVLIAYAIFQLYQNALQYIEHKKGLKEYKKTHSGCVWVDCSTGLVFLYIGLILITFGISVALYFIANDSIMSATTIFVTILFAAFAIEAKTKMSACIVKGDGFYYMDKTYQFNAIVSMKEVKRLFMTFVIVETSQGKSILISKNLGKILNDYYDTSK